MNTHKYRDMVESGDFPKNESSWEELFEANKRYLQTLAALEERLTEAERVIMPFAGKYNVLQAIGLTDSAMALAWPIDEPHLRAAAEWMKQK